MFVTLIVEDNVTFRHSLKELLNSHFPKMSIEEAADGKEALQKVEFLIPHLIFMDIKLPGANGLELTKRIKRDHDEIVVIVFTSFDLPEYREAAYRSGASYFFTKGSTSGDEIINLVGSLVVGNGTGEAEDRGTFDL